MSFGSVIGGIGDAAFGWGGWGSLAGQAFDAFGAKQNADRAGAEASAANAQQQQLLARQIQMQEMNRAEQLALRDRLLQQSSNLAAAMQEAYRYLGMPYEVNPEQITRDYMALREQNHGDLSRLVELTASRVHANDIARGMDSSTLARDNQAELFRRFAPQYQQADQAAFDAAVARSNATREAIAGSRNAMFGELGNVYGTQFNMERPLYTGAGGLSDSTMAAAGNIANTANQASAAASGTFGKMLGGIADNALPKIADWFAQQRASTNQTAPSTY